MIHESLSELKRERNVRYYISFLMHMLRKFLNIEGNGFVEETDK